MRQAAKLEQNHEQRRPKGPFFYGRRKPLPRNGGVHTNSGIVNKAAYLLSQGGTHYGVSVTGIGRDKMGNIFYRALAYYLTPTANFSQLRAACVQAAADLYGSTSQEVNAVKQAFNAVGVY